MHPLRLKLHLVGEPQRGHRFFQHRQRKPGVHHGAQDHVSANAHEYIEVREHRLQSLRRRTRLMRCAASAAPNPLSMFTTVTPAAQAFSIVSKGATPPKLAP